MRFSEDRIKKIALEIHDKLYLDNLLDYTDEDESLKVIKEEMLKFFKIEDEIDEIVRNKLMTLKKNLIPGTSEYNVMYQKYFEEEMIKKGM